MPARRVIAALVGAALTTTLVGASITPASAAKQPTLNVLVTNDDGAGAPGIDALVRALEKIPGLKITVVAPATNQSGTSDKTTPGTL